MVHQNVLHWVKMARLLYPSFKQSLNVDQPKRRCHWPSLLSAVDANSERAMELVASPSLDLDPSGMSSRLPLQHSVNTSHISDS